ncbi:MAG: D-amino acid dehydrogenase [Pseudomonadota bacterium]
MKVAVLGAGLAGVTAAHYLQQDGHEVTVVDRQPAAALETSFANAGLLSTGHAFAWASPRAAMVMAKSLFLKDQPLRLRPRAEAAFWRWSLKFLSNCTTSRAHSNTRIKHRLCRYAQQALAQVLDSTGIECDRGPQGLLYVHRTQESLERGIINMRVLQEGGQEIEVVDRSRAALIDPALAATKSKIAGGIFCPTDDSGDAHKFVQALAARCAAHGVTFQYNTTVQRLERAGDRIERVVTDRGTLEADVYVLALGSFSPLLTKSLGEALSVYPVKGYSVTIPVGDQHTPPTRGGIDEDNLCAYVRLGDRVRVTSVAEFAGYDTSYTSSDFDSLLRALRDLYPDAGDFAKPSYWACLRPMTPDGPPMVGRGRYRNLFYDTGHGHMGWTMSCGTGRIIADLIGGRDPDVPLEGLQPR